MENKTPLIVLDFETTGIKAGLDQVLQVSMIDSSFKTILNTYCKPIKITEWSIAQVVHGITPQMVKDCPTFIDLVPMVRELLDNTQYLMAYNANFELSFLREYGIFPDCPIIDPMLMFSEFYGEPGYHGQYKWQKLSKCAAYFKYEYNAHDALSDVKATLYCFNEMRKLGIKPKYIQK